MQKKKSRIIKGIKMEESKSKTSIASRKQVVLFLLTVVIVFLIGLFASSILERRSETATIQMVKPIAEWEPRNEVWGENYPREYETYRKTLDTDFASRHGGSMMTDLSVHGKSDST